MTHWPNPLCRLLMLKGPTTIRVGAQLSQRCFKKVNVLSFCTPTVVAQEGGAFSTQPLFCSVPLPSSSRGEGRCQLQMLPCSAWFPAAETHKRTCAFISTAAACQVRADQTSNQQHVKLIPHFLELFTGRRDTLKDNVTKLPKSIYHPWT